MPDSIVSPKSLPRLLVVDDEHMMHEVFRIAFDGICHVDGYCTGDEAILAAREFTYGVAVVDLQLKGMSGLHILGELKKMAPRIQVIILTGHASLESAIGAVNTGAFRFMLKPFQLAPMRAAVADAFARHGIEAVETSHVAADMLASLGISGRKAEVVHHVLNLRSTKEIAEELAVSPRTVEKHLESIFAVLGISSRRELIARMKILLRGTLLTMTGLFQESLFQQS